MISRSTESICPICGTTLLVDAAGGASLCVACAWQGATENENDPGSATSEDRLFRVPGHDVLAEIGRGGEGVVYRAKQLNPDREVALKMLLPRQLGSDEMIARFRDEAKTIAGLDHPAILPVFNADIYCGIPFFTMKLASGGTLAERRHAFHGRWREIATLVAGLADAVQFAHSRGVIHRDLKPGNILFDDGERAFVSDFGLAKFAGTVAATTPAASLIGTPAYLAPEIVQHGARAATTASDIYGLGGVFYELLTGTPPFSADSFRALLDAIATSPPAPPCRAVSDVPRDLEAICLRCLAKDPAQRFASASEVAAELRRWLEGRPILSRSISPPARLWRWCRRRPALAAMSGILVAVLVAGGIVQWRTNRSLSRALIATRAAEADARQKLHASLLAEARMQSRSHQPGQREKTLEILARAARISPTVEVRSETASALTRADITLVRELPGSFRDHLTVTDFTPDLGAYVAPGDDGGLVLRNTATGEIVSRYSMPTQASPRYIRFNGDGRVLNAAFSDQKSAFWLIETPAPAWIALPDSGISRPTAMHPSQPLVAYRGDETEVRTRNLNTGEERTIARDGSRIFALSYDPTGNRLAVIRKDAVELRDAATGAIIWSQPETPLGMIPTWSADGFWIATGVASRNDILIRDARQGFLRQTLSGHSTFPGIVKFLPDGQQAVSIAYDRTLRLWDISSGREMLHVSSMTRGLTLSPDGRRFGAATESDRLALFEWAESRVFRELPSHSLYGASTATAGLSASSVGAWVAVGDVRTWIDDGERRARQSVSVWNGPQQLATFARDVGLDARATIAFDPQQPTLAYSATSGGIWQRRLQTAPDGRIVLGEETRLDQSDPRFLVQIDREGDWIVQRLPGKSFALWPKGDPVRETDLFSRAAAPKGLIHVERHWAVSRDATEAPLRIWSIDTDTEVGQIATPHFARVGFSPRSDALVVATDETYQAWTLPGLRPGPQWPSRHDGSLIKEFSFSPSGQWFAGELGGSAIELRDGRTFDLLVRLEPPLDLEMSGLCWSADESRIYLRFRGPRVFYWDINALRHELASRGLDW